MSDLKVVVTLTQENCFNEYNQYSLRKEDLPLTVGSTVSIADIDCKISQVLSDGRIELTVPRSIEAFADDLKCSYEEFLLQVDKLVDFGKSRECDYYNQQKMFYYALYVEFKKGHTVVECGNTSCGKHVNTTHEHLKSGNKVYCQYNCKTTDQFIHESYL